MAAEAGTTTGGCPYAGARRDPVWDAGARAWVVSSHRLAKQVLGSNDFSAQAYEVLAVDVPRATDIFLADPAAHQRCRAAMGRAFMRSRARVVQEQLLPPRARRVADTLPAGPADFDVVTDFAAPYYRSALEVVTGVEPADLDLLRVHLEVAHAHHATGDETDRLRGFAAMELLYEEAREICGRAEPSTAVDRGLVPFLRAQQGSYQLTPDEIVGLMLSFVETLAVKVERDLTVSLCSELAAAGDRQAGLAGDPDAMFAAAGEAARLQHDGSVPRTVTRDVRLGDEWVRAGDRLLVLIGEADRDPAVFASPDTFDPGRPAGEHLGFGWGPRRCIGESVGRAIAAAGATALLSRGRLAMAAGSHRRMVLHGL